MKPLILLDFDGVLFNSAYEAYQVCEFLAKNDSNYRSEIPFEEFMAFRRQLTDAWQFSRLYTKTRLLNDFRCLGQIKPDEHDWHFADTFFEARAEMIKDPDWAKLMAPYSFFYQIQPLLKQHANSFRILSTRNHASIVRTLDFYNANTVEVFGQEEIRTHGSKLAVAVANNWIRKDKYVVYVDDMHSHLEPFESKVNQCIHADWGYDKPNEDSYSQSQAYQVINAYLQISND